MIPVRCQPEPVDFFERVKKDGEAFLHQVPNPTSKQFASKSYWQNVLPDIKRLHHSTCFYCAQWISLGTGSPTIDHYLAKSTHPTLAYEWSNFRLACQILNTRKSTYTDVLDPFQLKPGWFEIDFTSFMILPNPSLTVAEKRQVTNTVNRLRLNTDEAFIEARRKWFDEYMNGVYSFAHLEKYAPFVAHEVLRQDMRRH